MLETKISGQVPMMTVDSWYEDGQKAKRISNESVPAVYAYAFLSETNKRSLILVNADPENSLDLFVRTGAKQASKVTQMQLKENSTPSPPNNLITSSKTVLSEIRELAPEFTVTLPPSSLTSYQWK